MSALSDTQGFAASTARGRSVWRWFLLLACALSLSLVACESGKKSSGGSGGGGGGGGGGSAATNQVQGPVKGGAPPRTSEEKAQRVVNQLSNYLIGIAASQGSPETFEAAKQAVRDTNNLNWPNDPWGKPYVYHKSGDTTFEIFSAGPDGQDGTPDDIWPR